MRGAHGKVIKAGVALACTLGQPQCAVPAVKAVTARRPFFHPRRNKYWIEYVNDTGAGEPIWGKKALLQQGVPEHVVDRCLRGTSVKMEFET